MFTICIYIVAPLPGSENLPTIFYYFFKADSFTHNYRQSVVKQIIYRKKILIYTFIKCDMLLHIWT